MEKKKEEGNGQDKKNTKRCKFQDNTRGPIIQTPGASGIPGPEDTKKNKISIVTVTVKKTKYTKCSGRVRATVNGAHAGIVTGPKKEELRELVRFSFRKTQTNTRGGAENLVMCVDAIGGMVMTSVSNF